MKLQELNDKLKVLEMTKAMYGDWISSKLQIGTKSAFIVERHWKFITNIETKTSEIFELRKSPSGNEYIVGRFITTDKDEELFELILRITNKELYFNDNIYQYDNNLLSNVQLMIKEII